MSKISNLIDFYNSKQNDSTKITSNSKKFKIPDLPKPRKKEVSQLTTLSNSDINLICNTLKIPLKGVFMKDEFKLPLSDGYYVMNLQNLDENGSHWVAFVKIKSNVYYHDSYAVIMPQNQYDLFKSEQINIFYNTLQKQSLDTTSCGWWSIIIQKEHYKNVLVILIRCLNIRQMSMLI
jgi:hypothetical protein